MPKTIKKRDVNRRAPGEAPLEMEAFQETLTGFMEHRRSTVIQVLLLILVVTALGIGISVYLSSAHKKVEQLEAGADRSFLYSPQTETEDKNEHFREALSQYKEAASSGRSPYAAFQVGITHLKLSEYDEAFAAFERFSSEYQSTPLAPLARVHMARIRLVQDKPEETLDILTPAFKDTTVGDTALMLAADILKRTGREEESKNRLREIVERFPASSWALEANAALAAVGGESASDDAAATESSSGVPATKTAEEAPGKTAVGSKEEPAPGQNKAAD